MGIIHSVLIPGNMIVTSEGTVKIFDFILESTEFQPVSQPWFTRFAWSSDALPCGQGVAQQFLNFLPLPHGQ